MDLLASPAGADLSALNQWLVVSDLMFYPLASAFYPEFSASSGSDGG
jgi:hypothetical protein